MQNADLCREQLCAVVLAFRGLSFTTHRSVSSASYSLGHMAFPRASENAFVRITPDQDALELEDMADLLRLLLARNVIYQTSELPTPE